jgi:hypothetical protein
MLARIAKRTGLKPSDLQGAAQQRPEPDTDLAALDPRRLGLVRWAGEAY